MSSACFALDLRLPRTKVGLAHARPGQSPRLVVDIPSALGALSAFERFLGATPPAVASR